MKSTQIEFNEFKLTLEDVMAQIDVSGKEMYEDIVDELLEDAAGCVKPAAVWKEVAVSRVTEETVCLDETEFSSSYLAKRLDGVDKAYAFAVTIGDELWQQRASVSDALEGYLFDTIMKACLNLAFAETAKAIVLQLPKKVGLYMENPGHLSDAAEDHTAGNIVGWELADQRQFLDLLEDTSADHVFKVNERHLFETSYSLSGIIYAKGEVSSNCTLCPRDCSRRKAEFDSMALVMKLHGSTEEV